MVFMCSNIIVRILIAPASPQYCNNEFPCPNELEVCDPETNQCQANPVAEPTISTAPLALGVAESEFDKSDGSGGGYIPPERRE